MGGARGYPRPERRAGVEFDIDVGSLGGMDGGDACGEDVLDAEPFRAIEGDGNITRANAQAHGAAHVRGHPADGDPLLLPAREARRPAREEVAYSEALGDLVEPDRPIGW